jgi:hypothetical protein
MTSTTAIASDSGAATGRPRSTSAGVWAIAGFAGIVRSEELRKDGKEELVSDGKEDLEICVIRYRRGKADGIGPLWRTMDLIWVNGQVQLIEPDPRMYWLY